MSIHAHLSEEAQERLNSQQRNSKIASAVISILSVTVIALVLTLKYLPSILPDPPMIEAIYKTGTIVTPPTGTPPVDPSLRKPTPPAPSSAQLRALAANTLSLVSIPMPDVDYTEPSLDYGIGDQFDTGATGSDFGNGGDFAPVRPELKARCSKADRLARLQKMGGTVQGEEAVGKALQWLKATQNPDGSWSKDYPVAMTGFAILAYLGHCETPLSDEYGETVIKGITYLVNAGLKNDYNLTTKDLKSIQWVYEHGIATYALAESYTFCKSLNVIIPDLETVTKEAGDIIMKGQADSGGWLYKFENKDDGDNSVGFWQIQALKACKHTGLWPDSRFRPVIRKALGWLEDAQGKDGAIGYRRSSAKSPGLTGGGVLAFQMWDEGRSTAARKGIGYIDDNSGFRWGGADANLYYHYYNAQAMINHGGKEWEDYNDRFRDELIKGQKPDGSWDRGAGGNHGAINEHMATCLAALTLEVYYRFLPGTGAR